jgi:hypothetical protein
VAIELRHQVVAGSAPPLPQQIREARAHYADSLRQLAEATRFYEQTLREADELRELVPDETQRAFIMQRAIQDSAYWDAEASAAEIRLARLGRFALTLHMDGEPA